MPVFDCSKISLKQGAKGDAVKTLQTHLKTLGYYNSTVDGSFGPVTYNAVCAFQRAYKLDVDGWFGEQSCKKLNQVVDSKNTQTTTTTTTTTANGNTTTLKQEGTLYLLDCSKTSLRRGAVNDSVKILQTMLKEYGYYTRQIDGDFGVFTEQGVKAYQRQHGHDPDGWFGPKTCNTLTAKYAQTIQQREAAKQAEATKTAQGQTEDKPLGWIKPEYLKELTYKLTVLPEVVVLPDVEYDASTATKNVTEGSVSTEVNFDCTKIDLKQGSSGEDVKKLQTILKARGYYTRAIDGEFGQYTAAAVKTLQSVQGNDPDGWFGQKTCQKLQQTTATSNQATGTQDKKPTNLVITDMQMPSLSDDMEGISHEVTVKTPYSTDRMNRLRRLQKTQFDIYYETTVFYHYEGYINELKVTQENGLMLIEIAMCGYTAFLDTQLEYERTAKRSELIKDIAKLCGLKANVDVTGLKDDEFTVKSTKETSTGSSGGGGLTEVHGNDCTPTNPISAWSFDINACHGNTKIGDSSANYAQDTKNMSAKEAILDVYNRFKYGTSTSSAVYWNNKFCPKQMWNKSGKIYGNCADISRLIKAVGEVHGLKVGIRHCTNHYYNLIEINGKTYRFDCCFKGGVTGRNYGGEVCNTLTKNGGPWS